jgi:predicted aconitase with swiveling domain
MSTRSLLPGIASGTALVLDQPLSMWGGLDPGTGAIIDARHPQLGEVVTGRVLVMPAGRGSSSSSSVLAEAIRLGTSPAAIVLSTPDDIVLIGAIVAEELYGITCPVVVVDRTLFDRLTTGMELEVTEHGVFGQ